MVSPDRRVKMSEVPSSHAESEQFEFAVTYGRLRASFNCDVYSILELEVEARQRRQGYGKLLLREALFHAKANDAKAIVAPIVTHEEYDAMASVFGERNIIVKQLGDYAPEGQDFNPESPTEATLYMRLDIPQPRHLRAI
jgi:GNAT superfamily N-acetyltransferase